LVAILEATRSIHGRTCADAHGRNTSLSR
jgi:hypothetical protein